MPRLGRREFVASASAALGCGLQADANREVVVYCALDREFSEPILQRFEREAGVAVRANFDTESTKSVGLAERILREKNRPSCDLYWNNEIVNTLRLERAGRLAAYASPAGRAYPAAWRSAENRWFGFAARARVLLVHERQLADRRAPASLAECLDPTWKGRIGIAKPLFGTTATHAAYLFSAWGKERAEAWFRGLKANAVQVLSGNKRSAEQVGVGALTLGFTDTDDAAAEIAAGRPVRQVFLNQDLDGLGTPLIPNSLALVEGGPNPEAGRRLLDWLLKPDIELALAKCASKQIPLHPDNADFPQAKPTRSMVVDFAKVQAVWDDAMTFLRAEFAG
jgi:iron(III) transport system substrate-binding protein